MIRFDCLHDKRLSHGLSSFAFHRFDNGPELWFTEHRDSYVAVSARLSLNLAVNLFALFVRGFDAQSP